MNKYFLFLWALLSGMAQITHAQSLAVVDAQTGDGIAGATISSPENNELLITNDAGKADISPFAGADRIEIRAEGFVAVLHSFGQLSEMDFRVELEYAGFDLDAVVLSATRWQQQESDIPAHITRVSQREVSLLQPQTAADLLGLSGEVFIQKSQQGGGSPMIRGFATNRLLYTVDGVRMNTAIFRGGNLQNVISLDPFALQSTEVFFGPGSVVYGSDAIGGVMSFETLRPELSRTGRAAVHGQAAARYSSANQEQTAHFHVNIGGEKFASVTSFSTNDYDDLRMGSHGPEEYLSPVYVQRQDSQDVVITQEDPRIQRPSGYSQINLMQKFRFQPTEQWNLEYGFHYSETSDYGRYDRHRRTRSGLPRYAEWSYGPQQWMMNLLSVNHKGMNGLYDEVTLRLAHQQFEESRISRNLNNPNREIRVENVTALSANLDFVKALGAAHHLYYGLEAVTNDVVSAGTDENIATGTMADGPARYPQATWSSYAAYASGQFRLADPLLLHVGARYNQYLIDATFDTRFYPFPFTTANLNDGALTGSVGLTWRPTDSWVIKVSGASGFRAPNVDDIGKVFDSEPGAVTVPNPDLEAEYAWSGELGVAKVFGDWLKLDLTGYYTILQNAMVRRNFTLGDQDSILYDGVLSQVQAIQNAAVANVYGLQAGLELRFPGGFKLISDISFQQGEEELDDGTVSPSRHAAPWFGVTRLTYTHQKLELQVYAHYNGSRSFDELAVEEQGKTEIYAIDDNGNPWSPGWYTLNVKGRVQLSGALAVTAGVENLTDQRYRPYSSGIAGAGRNVVIAVEGRF